MGSEAVMGLTEALRALGLKGQADPSRRWVRIPGERCSVYVYEAAWDGGYYTWCDDPGDKTVEFYQDATEAIQAGLGRAGGGAGPIERYESVIEEGSEQPEAWH